MSAYRSWRSELRDPVFALFLVTALVSLIRAPDQPSFDVGASGTVVSVTPTDVLLLALLVAVGVRIARGARPTREAWPVLLGGLAFAGWLALSSLPNGSSAVVAAGKLVELGVLTLAASLVLARVAQLRLIVVGLVAFTVVGAIWAIVEFIVSGRRAAAFLGEHDLATLSTLALMVWLITLVRPAPDLGRIPLVAGAAGAVGITLGASFASLLGLYAAAGALLLLARLRHSLRLRAVLLTLLTCAAITAGTLTIRSDNLGFLTAWFGDAETAEPGATAGSWSQRLIYAYIGGRIFLDNPVVGTGWYGELPPEEYREYLPDAQRRFEGQPDHYFPQPDGTFIPQQAYDQVLFELGLVGAALLLLLGAASAWAALRTARRWRDGAGHADVGYVPATWLLTVVGALAGTALFGGTPLAALFWLVLGVVAAGQRLREPDVATPP
jgi:hypothetical protein